jgi:glycosyltransferase involved in cell wall biosynthesis
MAQTPAKILYCEGNVDGTVGGSYYSLLFLTEGLDRSRFTPLVIFRRETPLQPRFERAGIPVRVIERPSSFRITVRDSAFCRRHPLLCAPLAWLQSSVNLLRFCGQVVGLARMLRRERVQLVHLNNSVTRTHEWILAALLTRTPCVMHERGINEYFTPMARWLAPRLDAIICISAAVRDNLIERRVAERNLVLIHNGLDPDRVVPARTADEVRHAYGLTKGRKVIGLVGNIRAWKGQEVVIRALPAIVAKHPDVTCLFVGEASEADREFQQHLDRLISELGVKGNVVFTGYCANVADALNVMDIAVHASVAPEPFGRVLLEAMAMRKPIVGSRGGAVTEIVAEGETGFTFTPGSAEELARRVTELLDEPERAHVLGQAGYQRLVSEFHISRNVERTMAVYAGALNLES